MNKVLSGAKLQTAPSTPTAADGVLHPAAFVPGVVKSKNSQGDKEERMVRPTRPSKRNEPLPSSSE
jgi:hypothetical protein